MAAAIDGALDAAVGEAVRAHVEVCDECRAFFEAMQAADKEAHEALCGAAERAELSGHFTARVLTEIARRQGRRIPFMWRPGVRRLAFVAASVLVVAIGVWVGAHLLGSKSGTTIVEDTTNGGRPKATHRASVVLTTLDLPSVRDLAREILGEEAFRPESDGEPAGPDDEGRDQLNYMPGPTRTRLG
jgi:anti-sigma factor RsiW